MDLTPLELNLYKSDPVVISHIVHMIEVDNFQHQKTFEAVLAKTFEAVLADLWRNCNKEIHEQENETLHCIENENTHEEMDEKEVINLRQVRL